MPDRKLLMSQGWRVNRLGVKTAPLRGDRTAGSLQRMATQRACIRETLVRS